MRHGLRLAARCPVIALWAAFAIASPWSADAEQTASARLAGRVLLSLPDTRLADLGVVVVYLEALDRQIPFPPPAEPRRLHQRNARFSPSLLVVAAGQTIAMPNDDAIYHNVFSYSTGNEFDLGLYASGESRSVRLDQPGVVRTYCSIHESMNATIFVSPTPFFAVVDAEGEFAIDDIPPGRYRLHAWCELLPATQREVRLAPGEHLRLELPLDPTVP